MKVAQPMQKRQGTAALQDASRSPEPLESPTGFGLRQSSGAFGRDATFQKPIAVRISTPLQKRQGTAVVQDASRSSEPLELPTGLGLRQSSGAFSTDNPYHSFAGSKSSAT